MLSRKMLAPASSVEMYASWPGRSTRIALRSLQPKAAKKAVPSQSVLQQLPRPPSVTLLLAHADRRTRPETA